MLRRLILLFSALFITPCLADQLMPATNQANITMLVQAEMWATTNTAKVVTRINSVLNKTGLEQAYNTTLQKLAAISSKGIWHITTFNRSIDKSGLEQVEILAEARLPMSELAGIRDRAKKISHPGESYNIDDIDFHPSAEDLELARSKLRTKIYERSKIELANINQAYPNTHYSVRTVNFIPDFFYNKVDVARPTARVMMAAAPQPPAQLSASDKIQLSAVFEFTDLTK